MPVLTKFDQDEVVDDALNAGADGFLLKRATPEQLVDGIRTVFAGDTLVAPAVTRRLLTAHAARRPNDRERLKLAAQLTDREVKALHALAEGMSNAEIAVQVWLSPETVETYVETSSTSSKSGTAPRRWSGHIGPASLQNPPAPGGTRDRP